MRPPPVRPAGRLEAGNDSQMVVTRQFGDNEMTLV